MGAKKPNPKRTPDLSRRKPFAMLRGDEAAELAEAIRQRKFVPLGVPLSPRGDGRIVTWQERNARWKAQDPATGQLDGRKRVEALKTWTKEERAKQAARQARQRAPQHIPAGILRALVLARDERTCRYCRTTTGRFEIDHVVPVASGGATDATNLVTACDLCNRTKGARTWTPRPLSEPPF